jgi:hypothetical protein
MTTCHLLERRWAGRNNVLSWENVDATRHSRMEFRAATDQSGPMAVGYAAVFGRNSVNLAPSWCDYTVTEVIDPHAFDRTLREGDAVALWNHMDEALLGRVRSGTLRLSVDGHGLAYEIDLPDTTHGRDVTELLRRGDVRGSSFGFVAREQEWHEDSDGNITRTLLEVALIDVSPVTNPAYPDTDAALRSLAAAVGHPLDEVRAAVETRSLGRLITLPAATPDPVVDPVADPTPDLPIDPLAATDPEQRDEHPDAPAAGDPVAVQRHRHAWVYA